jgi:hypothetical protein
MFWKHPIAKNNRFQLVVHATNGIPSYFDHHYSKTSTQIYRPPEMCKYIPTKIHKRWHPSCKR